MLFTHAFTVKHVIIWVITGSALNAITLKKLRITLYWMCKCHVATWLKLGKVLFFGYL